MSTLTFAHPHPTKGGALLLNVSIATNEADKKRRTIFFLRQHDHIHLKTKFDDICRHATRFPRSVQSPVLTGKHKRKREMETRENTTEYVLESLLNSCLGVAHELTRSIAFSNVIASPINRG